MSKANKVKDPVERGEVERNSVIVLEGKQEKSKEEEELMQV